MIQLRLPASCRALSLASALLWPGHGAVDAAVQPAWLVGYDAGRPTGTNQAVAMLVDSHGDIVVTGSSTSANGDYDYVTIKYGPEGMLRWLARYASLSNRNDQVRALSLDNDDNVYITGTSATVKYSAEG